MLIFALAVSGMKSHKLAHEFKAFTVNKMTQ